MLSGRLFAAALLLATGCQPAPRPKPRPQPVALPTAARSAAAEPAVATGDGELKVLRHFGGPRWLTDAEVKVVAMSPDGRMLASGGGEDAAGDAVILWDAVSGERIGLLGGEDQETTQLRFSPDGATLAASALRQELLLWDVASRRVRARARSDGGSIYGITYAPNGEQIAAFSGNGVVMLFSAADGGRRIVTRDAKGIDGVAFSPNSAELAVAHEGRISIWDVATVKRLAEHPAGRNIHALSYGPRGGRLLVAETAASREQVSLLERSSGAVTATLVGHDHHINELRMLADGNTVVTGSSDATLRVWNVASGASRVIDAEGAAIWSLALSPDERVVAAAGQGRRILQWELATGKPKHPAAAHQAFVTAVAFSSGGELLASGDSDGRVVARDLRSGNQRYGLPLADGAIKVLRFTPDGRLLLTVSSDTIRAFDARTGAPASAPLASMNYSAITLSPDGRLAVGSTEWPVVDLIDVASGAVLRRLGAAHSGGHRRQNLMRATSVAFSPDGKRVATARWDEPVKVFEVSSGQRVMELPGTLNVAYGPQQLLAANVGTLHKRRTDLKLKLWDLASGDERCVIAADGGAQFVVRGELVAAIVDGEIRFWSSADCALAKRAVKTGHSSIVFALSPDGKHVVSGGRDGDVVVWHAPR